MGVRAVQQLAVQHAEETRLVKRVSGDAAHPVAQAGREYRAPIKRPARVARSQAARRTAGRGWRCSRVQRQTWAPSQSAMVASSGSGVLVEQRVDGQDQPGGAEAALHGRFFQEGLLHRVEPAALGPGPRW